MDEHYKLDNLIIYSDTRYQSQHSGILMIQELHIENFKGFKKYDIKFDRLNLLVGGNNSGKTTLFHALQTVFWCIEKTADTSSNTEVVFIKTQVPEIGAFPYFALKDIFYRQKTREGGSPKRIKFKIKFQEIPELSFSIYPAFSRNLMVDGNRVKISKEDFEKITKKLKPVFVPSTIGITVKEELYRPISQERLISEGRQNEVLRNQIYRLKQNSTEWEEFKAILSPIFKLGDINVPFDETKDEWLSVLYGEDDCEFDCISAGSGFLQLLNLLVFVFLHESRVALLDEPDSHMHSDLQQISFDLLHTLSERRNIQLIIATHSPTFIDAAGLENVHVIDKNVDHPLRTQKIEELVPLLADMGIALPPAKVIDTLKSRKVIFVESNDADYNDFLKILGNINSPDFSSKTRGLTVFETEGATKKWPFDAIKAFEKLLGLPIKFVFISDKDFETDNQITEKQTKITPSPLSKVHFLSRRHRESYLCDPKILARLLKKKWELKNTGQILPDDLSEEKIKEFFVNIAKQDETETQTKFQLYQQKYLKGNDTEKLEKMSANNLYFKENYSDVINQNEIPYKLFNCKDALRKFREHIQKRYKISFGDKDILLDYTNEDIPLEIKNILNDVYGMFD